MSLRTVTDVMRERQDRRIPAKLRITFDATVITRCSAQKFQPGKKCRSLNVIAGTTCFAIKTE